MTPDSYALMWKQESKKTKTKCQKIDIVSLLAKSLELYDSVVLVPKLTFYQFQVSEPDADLTVKSWKRLMGSLILISHKNSVFGLDVANQSVRTQ